MQTEQHTVLVTSYLIHHQYWLDACKLERTLRSMGVHRTQPDVWDNVTAIKAIADLRKHDVSQMFTAAHWEELHRRRG